MQTAPQRLEVELMARRLRRDEEATRALAKEPGRMWSILLGAAPVVVQMLFGKQIEQYLGIPSSAAWLIVVTLATVLYLSWEVSVLRSQVKALHYLLRRNAGDA
jgi:hypothetical protein